MPISTIGSNSLNQTSDLTINGLTVGKGGGSVSTNTAVGASALASNSTGAYLTSVGTQALTVNTNSFSSAFGYQAGYSNTSGTQNTYLGRVTGYSNITGNNNVYVGDYTGYAATGSNNCFVGFQTGYQITSGAKNTIIGGYNGNQSSLDIRTSSNNIVLSDGDGNPRAGVNSNGWFWVNQGGSSTPYYNSTYHRINSAVSQGTVAFTISSYPTSNNDSISVYAVSGGNPSSAGTALWVSANSSTARSINAAGTINGSGSYYSEYMT